MQGSYGFSLLHFSRFYFALAEYFQECFPSTWASKLTGTRFVFVFFFRETPCFHQNIFEKQDSLKFLVLIVVVLCMISLSRKEVKVNLIDPSLYYISSALFYNVTTNKLEKQLLEELTFCIFESNQMQLRPKLPFVHLAILQRCRF